MWCYILIGFNLNFSWDSCARLIGATCFHSELCCQFGANVFAVSQADSASARPKQVWSAFYMWQAHDLKCKFKEKGKSIWTIPDDWKRFLKRPCDLGMRIGMRKRPDQVAFRSRPEIAIARAEFQPDIIMPHNLCGLVKRNPQRFCTKPASDPKSTV